MKKILNCFLIMFPFLLFAQVGIGTNNPRGALDINGGGGTSSHGLVLPRNDNPSLIQNPQGGNIAPGTMFYDWGDDCIKLYTGTSWSNCLGECACEDPPSPPEMPDVDCYNTGYISSPSTYFDEDPIRPRLSTSLATYDAANEGDLVYITKTEYESIVNGSASFNFNESNARFQGIDGAPQHTSSTSYTMTSNSNRFKFQHNTQYNDHHLIAYAIDSPGPQTVQFQLFRVTDPQGADGQRLLLLSLSPVQVGVGKQYFVFKNRAVTIRNLGINGSTSNADNYLWLGAKASYGLYRRTDMPGYGTVTVNANQGCRSYGYLSSNQNNSRYLINAGGLTTPR